ncbi:hypothetical protein B5F40_01165 [Gordonibacter sp. An230]|uniref:DmsC/YnfH family molybdoenzyme membrane anchor subunit n=1 Tax=Gordonibacter sp. An230 TaxID=1965592 RepID=UPI000B3653CF|nr:DmsC/YnfH family molybdoenzyme membrane anchor subunit [Gordonibacter sp. An230]OUO92531.1 hypothetical protein B5F40_01165 [Gordonibacter sp. An230]
MEIQWSLVFFAAFICWGAGIYAMTVVFRGLFKAPERIVAPAFVVAAVTVVVGAIASMTHLGHIDRIFGVLSNPGSGIFVEGLSAALLVMIVIVYLVAEARKASAGTLRALAIVGVVPAFVVTFAVGSSYLMVARPAWNVVVLPLVSITTALSLGSVTVLAIDALTAGRAKDADVEAPAAKRMDAFALALVAVHAVAVAAYAVSVATAPYQDASRSAARMLTGDMALLFWGVVVVLGIGAPLAALLVRNRKGASVALAAAAVCMVAAAVAFRVIMFSLGSSIIDFGFTL